MATGKCPAFQNAVDSYIDNIRDVVNELNNFGDTAMQVISGGTTDGADLGISGTVVSSDGVQNWQFIADIEASLRKFVVGSAGTDGGSATGIMWYLCSIAIAISMVFFLISIIQLVTEDRFTPEFLVKFFAKFVIAFCVIIWSPTILAYMIDFGHSLAVDVSQAAKELLGDGTGEFDPVSLEKLIKNHSIRHYKNVGWDNWSTSVSPSSNAKNLELWGVWEGFKFWFEGSLLGIYKFISYLLNAVVMFIMITRILELYVRGAFLPIAAALMSDDGWKGAGGRYFRKLMSLASQTAAIVMVANLLSAMVKTAINSIFTSSILAPYRDNLCEMHQQAEHLTLEAVATCTTCLDEIPAPINVPVMKPMMICAVLCVTGLAAMFKTAALMDDIWGAR